LDAELSARLTLWSTLTITGVRPMDGITVVPDVVVVLTVGPVAGTKGGMIRGGAPKTLMGAVGGNGGAVPAGGGLVGRGLGGTVTVGPRGGGGIGMITGGMISVSGTHVCEFGS
jgi:hypothetical protein